MALADRITNPPEKVQGYPCSVASLIAQAADRGPGELAALQVMLYGKPGLTEPTRSHRGWDERDVYETVTAEGYKVARTQINIHRGKKCRCYRSSK